MHFTAFVLGSLLFGQTVGESSLETAREIVPPQKSRPAALQPIAEPESAAAAGGTVPPSEPAPSRPTPPEMVAEALKLPPQSKLTGRPLRLLTAISSAPDRWQQLHVTVAYWRLVQAVAKYRFAWHYDDRLLRFADAAAGEISWRVARASSAAMLREAEVAAVVSQHELAALVLARPDAPLPLPADRPHAGPYRTYFEELFVVRIPPARAKLIDRTLPVRCLAIESRAAAVRAAEAAEAEAVAAYGQGRADLPTVLAVMQQSLRQHEALIESVCRYNEEIADYVLAVADPGTTPPALLRMMITPVEDPVRTLANTVDPQVRPAGHQEPAPTPAKRPGVNVPTPATRPGVNVPTPAKRPPQTAAPQRQWSASEPSVESVPALGPPGKESDADETAVPQQPAAGDGSGAGLPLSGRLRQDRVDLRRTGHATHTRL